MAQDTPEAPAGAVAAPSLSDFFSKKKKKIATTNLNKDTTTSKPEASKPKKKDAEDGEWQEDEPIAATTLKVGAAGNLATLNDGKDDEDTSAPAWSNMKKEKKETAGHLKPHMYPSLARSMIHKHAVGVHDDDIPAKGMTAKNAFSALGGGGDDSDDEVRQTHKPAMAKKQKGEMERKVGQEKEPKEKSGGKAARGAAAAEEEDEDRDGSGDESPKEKSKKKTPAQKSKAAKAAKEAEAKDESIGLLIEVDLKAAEAKYVGRRKLVKQAIPREELEEEKVSKVPDSASKGGKKKVFKDFEDEEDKKYEYVDE